MAFDKQAFINNWKTAKVSGLADALAAQGLTDEDEITLNDGTTMTVAELKAQVESNVESFASDFADAIAAGLGE